MVDVVVLGKWEEGGGVGGCEKEWNDERVNEWINGVEARWALRNEEVFGEKVEKEGWEGIRRG